MINNLVINQNNQAITTSLKVAEVFGKEHKTILRSIDGLVSEIGQLKNEQSSKTGQHKNVPSDFVKTTYLNLQGKKQPCYEMTRDGFTLLAMGFTGKKALEFKLAYIDAFNKMEKALTNAVDFEKVLTTPVRQHTRKLPMVRVKKEINLAESSIKAVSAIIANTIIKKIKEQSLQIELFKEREDGIKSFEYVKGFHHGAEAIYQQGAYRDIAERLEKIERKLK